MYERRKIIFNLLKFFEGKLDKIKFSNLLYLFCIYQKKKYYNFLYYNSCGFYSYLVEYDLEVLRKNNFINLDEIVTINKYPVKLDFNESHINILEKLKKSFENINTEELLEYIKRKHYKPIKSELNKKNIVYTLGYEGKDIDSYLDILIKNGISFLVDVRKNPISMKYGFSKRQLEKICTTNKIRYYHFPELGIESSKRKNLNCFQDYINLFSYYINTSLSNRTDTLNMLIDFIYSQNKVAFTCFESNPKLCHRSYLLNYIIKRNKLNFEIYHL